MINEKILIVEKIVKKYPNFFLDNISFELPRGSITGFIGKNGAGKSTTLKAILGLIKVDSGNVKLNLDMKNNVYPIGYLGMDKGIYPDEKLSHISGFVGRSWGNSWNEKEFRNYAKNIFGLNLDQKMRELSTGMTIKFLISMELAKDPKLLLLDEPTSGLDPIVRDEILAILSNLVSDKGITVLFSSHITEDIVKIADRVIFINNGQIVLQDFKETILKNYVKIEKHEVEKLPDTLKAEIISKATYNNGWYIWDKTKMQLIELKNKNVGLDDVLIALGGKEHV